MPNACVPANIWVLLLQPGHHQDDVVAGIIGNDKVDRMASLDASAVKHALYILYDGRSIQRRTIDCGNRERVCKRLFSPPRLCRAHSDKVSNCLGDENVCRAQSTSAA